MSEHIELLKHIISKSKSLSIFVDNDVFYYEFEKEVINQFNYFINSSYYYMLMIYPVIFMQISYYIIFKKFIYGSDSIFDFIDIFVHYQKRTHIKYIEMLTAIYGKINSFNETGVGIDKEYNSENINSLINKMSDIELN
jgi:hypothetical protein